MNETFNRKYKKVLEILPDVAECAEGGLILVGGTALALFYLRHRVSVDLDFVPVQGDEVAAKERLKGCLTKKGYRTIATRYKNQFVVQFEDTSIKVEVFVPKEKIQETERHIFGGAEVTVASLSDIFRMKISAYSERKEARDLFDILAILRFERKGDGIAKKLVRKFGLPENTQDVDAMALDPQNAALFRKVISDVA